MPFVCFLIFPNMALNYLPVCAEGQASVASNSSKGHTCFPLAFPCSFIHQYLSQVLGALSGTSRLASHSNCHRPDVTWKFFIRALFQSEIHIVGYTLAANRFCNGEHICTETVLLLKAYEPDKAANRVLFNSIYKIRFRYPNNKHDNCHWRRNWRIYALFRSTKNDFFLTLFSMLFFLCSFLTIDKGDQI